MRRSYKLGLIVLALLGIVAFTVPSKKNPDKKQKMENPIVTFETNYGVIKVKLYNETPLHRDNFIKLAEEHYFDSLLFHRVIENFMIQAGDPNSKGAAPGVMLGTGGPGYTIPAEFNPNLIHKKGALAAARLGGPQNPKKESSGSQFYIVVGQKVPMEQLDAMAAQKSEQAKGEYIQTQLYKPENKDVLNELITLQKAGDRENFMIKWNAFEEKYADSLKTIPTYNYTENQKNIYQTLGGTPHLDMDYTVFGEVIDGLSVVDSIAAVKTDRANRPLEDVIIIKVSVEK
ncbi:MAG: peptidylprolyl isomerase [Bacteroidales bacterium]|nr:peptidylprolyl isomerase [Bacteroidales bacterium]MBR6265428.1 peptidylprolyl isomerase [Bacteroidales bacterium]